MKNSGVSRVKFLIWACLAALLIGAGLFAWSWGRIEFHAQRLDAEDGKVALSSELELLALGKPGRDALFDFLLNKHNIKLPPLSVEGGAALASDKLVAVAESGEVSVAGSVGQCEDVVLLADSSAPVAKVCRPLAELARAGTGRVLAVALTPGSELAAVEIDLVFLSTEQLESYLTLRVDENEANLEGQPVAHQAQVAALLQDKAAESVRVAPRPDVRYARFIRFVYFLRAAGRRPVLVFGEAEALGMPSLEAIDELTRSMSSADGDQQVKAAVRLKTAMGELFSYDTSRSPADNRESVESWSKWLEKNRSFVYFDAIRGTYAYDAAAAAAEVESGVYWLGKLRILENNPNGLGWGKEEDQ